MYARNVSASARWHGIVCCLPPFSRTDRPSGAAQPEVLDLHIQRRANPRERVGEGGNQCAVPHIAQGHVRYGLQQLAPLAALEHRRLAGFHDMLRTADRRGRIRRHHLAGDQPVEQHPDRGQLLLDRRRRNLDLQLLYISSNVVRPDRRRYQTAIFTSREKLIARPGIGTASIWVADVGGKEFDIPPGGFVAEICDQRGDDVQRALVGGDLGLLDRRRKLLVGPVQCAPPTVISHP
jgi:hypothetical protein